MFRLRWTRVTPSWCPCTRSSFWIPPSFTGISRLQPIFHWDLKIATHCFVIMRLCSFKISQIQLPASFWLLNFSLQCFAIFLCVMTHFFQTTTTFLQRSYPTLIKGLFRSTFFSPLYKHYFWLYERSYHPRPHPAHQHPTWLTSNRPATPPLPPFRTHPPPGQPPPPPHPPASLPAKPPSHPARAKIQVACSKQLLSSCPHA